MSENIDLPTSTKQSQVHRAAIVIVGVAVYLLIFFFVGSLARLSGIDLNSLKIFGAIVVIGFVAIGLMLTWIRDQKYKYSLSPEGIVVRQVNGLMGGIKSKVYPYRHITSLEVYQSMMGAKSGYGSVYVNMDSLERFDKISLDNLENPNTALKQIQEFMKTQIRESTIVKP